MIRTVRNEYPEFPAALSFIPMLSAAEARDQLLARRIILGKEIAAMRALAGEMNENYQLPRLFVIEDEYRLAMLEAEHSLGGSRHRRPGQRRTVLGPRHHPGLGGRAAAADGFVPRNSATGGYRRGPAALARQDCPQI